MKDLYQYLQGSSDFHSYRTIMEHSLHKALMGYSMYPIDHLRDSVEIWHERLSSKIVKQV
jgi:hypothetical protein